MKLQIITDTRISDPTKRRWRLFTYNALGFERKPQYANLSKEKLLQRDSIYGLYDFPPTWETVLRIIFLMILVLGFFVFVYNLADALHLESLAQSGQDTYSDILMKRYAGRYNL